MTLITGIILIAVPLFQLILLLGIGFYSHIVTSTAAFAALHQLIRFHVSNGKGHHGSPSEIMLSLNKLIELIFVTFTAFVFSGEFDQF